MTLPFDPRALTHSVDRNAVRENARRLRAHGAVPSLFSTSLGTVITMIALGVMAFFILSFGGGILTFVIAGLGSGNGLVAVPALGFILLMLAGITVVVIAVAKQFAGAGERWYRLGLFAQANGMTYIPHLEDPPLPGMIFHAGRARKASDLVRGERPRFVEFGNYQYTTGSGKNQTTHKWGYVAVKLDVPLPNIVLDATSNNGLFGSSNLPATFGKEQRLSLEGDFDRYFSLYCPQGYETDALYLFTPDIMARFIDNAAAMDVEIVDDWLFLYGKRPFSTLDPATWAWLFSVVGALLDKFAQWARWRDERLAQQARAHAASAAAPAPAVAGAPGATVAPGPAGTAAPTPPLPFVPPVQALRPPPGVAPPGRRLQRKTPWVAFVVVGAFLLFWFFMQSGIIGALFLR